MPFDNDTIYYENNVWKAKQGGGNNWEKVDTSDLKPGAENYQIKNFDKDNYIYKIWFDIEKYSCGPLITRPKFTKSQVSCTGFGTNPTLNEIYSMELSTTGLIDLHNLKGIIIKLYGVFIQRKNVS